jgi:hypothetical protein
MWAEPPPILDQTNEVRIMRSSGCKSPTCELRTSVQIAPSSARLTTAFCRRQRPQLLGDVRRGLPRSHISAVIDDGIGVPLSSEAVCRVILTPYFRPLQTEAYVDRV